MLFEKNKYPLQMRRCKMLVIIVLTVLCLQNTSAETPYVFHHLTTNDGLSNNSVKSLLIDSYGFLWAGTEFGLNRFDGYSFKTFLTQPTLRKSIPLNNIIGLQEDGLRNIWIDFRYSYVVYNRDKDNFFTDINEILSQFGIKVNGSYRVYVDKNKNLVVINGNKMSFYNTLHKTLDVFTLPEINYSGLDICDDQNNVYLVDNESYCWQINKKSGATKKIPLPTAGNINFINTRSSFFADSGGYLWAFSSKDEFVYYTSAVSIHWQKIHLNSSIKMQNNIISIVEDKNNRIWIATDHKGLFIYDKSDGSLSNITSNAYDQSSIASNNITCMYVDKNKTVWVGHDKRGVSFYNECFRNFINEQTDQLRDVSRILELRNGNILFGTDGNGLFIEKAKTKEISKMPLPNTAIVSMLEDKKGRIWIGTYQLGLFCLEGNKISHFTTDNSNLSSDNIWGLIEDKFGNIWIGALGGKIQKYMAGNTSNFFETPFDEMRYVSDMIYDGNDKIYFSNAYGITIIEILDKTSQRYFKNIKETQRFNNQEIFNIYKDSRNLLWVGTNSGISVWNLDKDSLINIDIKDGLSDNIIRGVVEDNKKNIWVSTSNGLSVLSVEKDNNGVKIINSKNFSTKDGLESNYFNNHSICKIKNGSILVGTTEGYSSFSPDRVAERKQPLSKIYFTRISIGNTHIDVDSVYNHRVVLKKSIELTPVLNLKYKDKLITLEFTTLDLIYADKIKYFYKIEGFSNQWIATKKNEINITSLPVGKYKLLIKACNSDGVWNSEAKSLIIHVAPPFYYSFWAIAIYALLLIWLILFIIRRGQRQHALKLEEQKRQMLHEHELKINDMKMRFFTNISHDLRTPLTLIISPLQTLLKETNDEILNKKLQVMFKNAKQLLSLINSLLDFRKLDVGAEKLKLKSGNVVELMNEIYSSFDVYATERKIHFKLKTSVDTLWLDYDNDKIQKCVVNLLSNAFKYTPNGGEIELSLYTHQDDVCISVSDSGIGISDEDKKNVFNRFYQTEQKEANTGSGIGLHIVSEYIKLHHGSVEVSDNKPSGCVFLLRFPAIKTMSIEPPLDEAEDVIGYAEIEQKVVISKKPVVLFVDDNQDLCEFIHDNLKDEFSIFIANDGQKALATLKQHDVNIVVSDIMMPVMDGIELCRRIKTNIEWSHIPVILLTARTAEEQKVEGLEIGADDYITKPFNLDIVKLRILKFIEWGLKSHKTFKQKLDVNPSEITITSLDEKLIEKAINIVEEHISDSDFSVEMLGEILGLSRGHLYKKLIAITGKGPAEFIKTIRLKRAIQLLEKSQKQIAEIAYEVGYNSPKRFTIHFKEEFGVSPSEYVKRMKQ